MSESNPFFSIIIPTFNRSELIVTTLLSTLNQIYDDLEVIVVDDGGSDNTEQVVSSLSNIKIRYFKKENGERGAARNFGLKKATGNYVTFLDSDDLLYPNYLSEAIRFIKEKNLPDFFYQGYNIVNKKGEKILVVNKLRSNSKLDLILEGNFLACQGVFVKREIALKNLFNDDYFLSGSEDYELWLRLSNRFDLIQNPVVTSALVEHEDRSVININPNNLIKRKELMLSYLQLNEEFNTVWKKYRHIIKSNAYSYISLHLALANYKSLSLKYFFLSVWFNPNFLFKRRFLTIIKNLL